MHLSLEEKETLAIKDCRNGKGIFAKKVFSPKEVVFEVGGTFLTCDEDEDVDEETRNNTYRYNKDLFLSPKDRIGDMLNHSCEPNAKVVKKAKRLFVVAIKEIPRNTEVCIDYSTIIARDDTWHMQCNCGTESCRGIVKKFNLLPKRIKDNYIKSSIVPSYILEI